MLKVRPKLKVLIVDDSELNREMCIRDRCRDVDYFEYINVLKDMRNVSQ